MPPPTPFCRIVSSMRMLMEDVKSLSALPRQQVLEARIFRRGRKASVVVLSVNFTYTNSTVQHCSVFSHIQDLLCQITRSYLCQPQGFATCPNTGNLRSDHPASSPGPTANTQDSPNTGASTAKHTSETRSSRKQTMKRHRSIKATLSASCATSTEGMRKMRKTRSGPSRRSND